MRKGERVCYWFAAAKEQIAMSRKHTCGAVRCDEKSYIGKRNQIDISQANKLDEGISQRYLDCE